MASSRREIQFETVRTRSGNWRDEAARLGKDLPALVSGVLTPRTTHGLPDDWQGAYDHARAEAWIADRVLDSTVLLVTEVEGDATIGLIILGEDAGDPNGVDLRVGYVLVESQWGRGFAGEALEGLVAWARTQPEIATITGGVGASNDSSRRVLQRAGFAETSGGHDESGTVTYRIDVANAWDSVAAEWDDSPTARAYAAAAFDSLGVLISGRSIVLADARVLDFGCGTGLLTELLVESGAYVHAVDSSPAMMEVLRAKISGLGSPNVTASTELSPDALGYDMVVCSSVCAFVDDYPATVADLAGRLADGGLFVQWDWERVEHGDPGLTRDEIRSAISRAGLIDVDVDVGFTAVVDDVMMAPLMGSGWRSATKPDYTSGQG